MCVLKKLNLAVSLVLRVVVRLCYSAQANDVLVRVCGLIKDNHSENDLENLVDALVQAEDHRFYSHYGVDVYAVFRAVIITALTGKTQGGSTITQQLVRVVTGNFRRSVIRKFKEMCLAAWVDSKLPKQVQAIAYLHVAYYGWKMNGLSQAVSRLGFRFPCAPCEAAAIIARLKYPEPQNPSLERIRKIRIRQEHILHLMMVRK